MKTRTVIIGTAVPAAILLAGISRWSHLPEPMATHFSVGGDPDGSLPRWLGLLVPAAVAASGFVAMGRAPARTRAATTTFLVVLGAVAQALLITANDGVADWRQAREPGSWMLLILLGVPAAAAGVASRIAGRAPAATEVPVGLPDVPTGDHVVWTGTARNRGLLALDLAVAALAVVSQHWVVGVVVAVLIAPLWRLRLSIGQAGVVLALGAPVLLRRTYRLDAIRRATPGDHQGFSYGYRGSRKAFGLAVWAIRRGECLDLEMTDGSTLRITVDDAARGAAVLNGLLARA
jgi:hypothetical protein